MNAVKSEVEKLVQKELESANQRFQMFRSDHEGYAVLKEEIEEAYEETVEIKDSLDCAWSCIRIDSHYENCIENIKNHAIFLACEAIQVAAMAQKFIDGQKESEKNEDN